MWQMFSVPLGTAYLPAYELLFRTYRHKDSRRLFSVTNILSLKGLSERLLISPILILQSKYYSRQLFSLSMQHTLYKAIDYVEEADLQIVMGCLKGDRKCQNELYQSYKNQMYLVCLRYAQDSREAGEMLQIGFTEVFLSLPKWRQEGPLGAWIRKVIVNQSLMQLRKKLNYNEKVVPLEIVHSFENKEHDALDELAAEELHNMISTIPLGYKTIFNLYVIEGYKHEEIAEMLSITTSTSKTQLRKAKLYLQNELTNKKVEHSTPKYEING